MWGSTVWPTVRRRMGRQPEIEFALSCRGPPMSLGLDRLVSLVLEELLVGFRRDPGPGGAEDPAEQGDRPERDADQRHDVGDLGDLPPAEGVEQRAAGSVAGPAM
jgi:hypothetical protein